MSIHLYAGTKHGKPVFFIRAKNIKEAMSKFKKFRHIYKIEKMEQADNKKGKIKGKIIYLD